MQVIFGMPKMERTEKDLYSPSKKTYLVLQLWKKSDSDLNIFLDGNKVDVSNLTEHMGIQNDTTGKADIEGRIPLCRKTSYSLMDPGLLRTTISGLPSLFLDCSTDGKFSFFKKNDIENLERFQGHCLKTFQRLPDNTSKSK